MTKETTRNGHLETIQIPKDVLIAGSSRTQPQPRILDRRDPKDRFDNARFFQYEFPPADEVERLEGTSIDGIIRWVLDRYEVSASARRDHFELLKMDDVELHKQCKPIDQLEPVLPARRERFNKSHRAHSLVNARNLIREALGDGDFEAAVEWTIQGILDCELHLKYLALPRLSVLTGGSGVGDPAE